MGDAVIMCDVRSGGTGLGPAPGAPYARYRSSWLLRRHLCRHAALKSPPRDRGASADAPVYADHTIDANQEVRSSPSLIITVNISDVDFTSIEACSLLCFAFITFTYFFIVGTQWRRS